MTIDRDAPGPGWERLTFVPVASDIVRALGKSWGPSLRIDGPSTAADGTVWLLHPPFLHRDGDGLTVRVRAELDHRWRLEAEVASLHFTSADGVPDVFLEREVDPDHLDAWALGDFITDVIVAVHNASSPESRTGAVTGAETGGARPGIRHGLSPSMWERLIAAYRLRDEPPTEWLRIGRSNRIGIHSSTADGLNERGLGWRRPLSDGHHRVVVFQITDAGVAMARRLLDEDAR